MGNFFKDLGRKIEKEVKRAATKVYSEWDDYLDDALGIDNPELRTGIMVAGTALAGGAAGYGLSGAAAGGAFTGGLGLSAGAATTAAVVAGTTAGAIAGSNLAVSALSRQEEIDAIITKGFPLPTAFDLTIGEGQLKSNLSAQRKRSQSRFSGGLTGGSFAAPTLFTT